MSDRRGGSRRLSNRLDMLDNADCRGAEGPSGIISRGLYGSGMALYGQRMAEYEVTGRLGGCGSSRGMVTRQ